MNRRTLVAAALATAALGSPLVGDAAARPRLGCHSGETLFEAGRTRVFEIARHDHGSWHAGFYGCSARLTRPRRFHSIEHAGPVGFVAPTRFGHRVLLIESTGSEGSFGGSSYLAVGWWDERTGRTRWGPAGTTDLPANGPRRVSELAIAPSGAVALAYDLFGESGDPSLGQRIAVMCVGRRRLTAPRELARLPVGTVRHTSLSATRTRIRWRTRQGTLGGVPYACPAR